MVIFVRIQGKRKFQPQEYIEYFEDSANRVNSAVLQRSPCETKDTML